MPSVLLNGENRAIDTGATIADLVASLGIDRKQVAVERNREVVPRAEHDTTVLRDGDRIEVVTFVGGG